MPQQPKASRAQKEARVQLAKQAIEKKQFQSSRGAAKAHNAVETTLRRRRAGIRSRDDCTANGRLLSDLEENVIVRYILDLDTRGYPPNLHRVGEMANSILNGRNARHVGKNWPGNFVN